MLISFLGSPNSIPITSCLLQAPSLLVSDSKQGLSASSSDASWISDICPGQDLPRTQVPFPFLPANSTASTASKQTLFILSPPPATHTRPVWADLKGRSHHPPLTDSSTLSQICTLGICPASGHVDHTAFSASHPLPSDVTTILLGLRILPSLEPPPLQVFHNCFFSFIHAFSQISAGALPHYRLRLENYLLFSFVYFSFLCETGSPVA